MNIFASRKQTSYFQSHLFIFFLCFSLFAFSAQTKQILKVQSYKNVEQSGEKNHFCFLVQLVDSNENEQQDEKTAQIVDENPQQKQQTDHKTIDATRRAFKPVDTPSRKQTPSSVSVSRDDSMPDPINGMDVGEKQGGGQDIRESFVNSGGSEGMAMGSSFDTPTEPITGKDSPSSSNRPTPQLNNRQQSSSSNNLLDTKTPLVEDTGKEALEKSREKTPAIRGGGPNIAAGKRSSTVSDEESVQRKANRLKEKQQQNEKEMEARNRESKNPVGFKQLNLKATDSVRNLPAKKEVVRNEIVFYLLQKVDKNFAELSEGLKKISPEKLEKNFRVDFSKFKFGAENQEKTEKTEIDVSKSLFVNFGSEIQTKNEAQEKIPITCFGKEAFLLDNFVLEISFETKLI